MSSFGIRSPACRCRFDVIGQKQWPVCNLSLTVRCWSSFCRCVGVWQHDRVEIIPNDQGNRVTPSYVAFTDTERLVGDAAKNQVCGTTLRQPPSTCRTDTG